MTSDVRLKLYTENLWDSPYVFTAFVALTEKRLPFDTVPLALDRGEQRQPEYRQHSLTAKVPTLVDGDFWLSESSAIVEYLGPACRGRGFRWFRSDTGGSQRYPCRSASSWWTRSDPLHAGHPPRSGLAGQHAGFSPPCITHSILYNKVTRWTRGASGPMAPTSHRRCTGVMPAHDSPIVVAGDHFGGQRSRVRTNRSLDPGRCSARIVTV